MKVDTTTRATKPSDYVAIARWGKRLGSYDYYIHNEQAQAFRDNAPINAIYKRDDWHTAETITNKELRDYILNGDK
jgi:hypothetical protein